MEATITAVIIGGIALAGYSYYTLKSKKIEMPCGPCEKPKWWYKCSPGTGEGSDLCNKYKKYTPKLKEFSQAKINDAKSLIKLVKNKSALLYAQLINLKKKGNDLFKILSEYDIKTLIKSLYENEIKPFIDKFIEDVSAVVETVVGDNLKPILDYINGFQETFMETLETLIFKKLREDIEKIQEFANDLKDEIYSRIKSGLETIQKQLNNLEEGIIKLLNGAHEEYNKFVGTVEMAINAIDTNFTNIVTTLNKTVNTTLSEIFEKSKSVIDTIKDSPVINFSVESIDTIKTELTNGVKTFVGNIKDYFKTTLLPKIKDAISGVINGFKKTLNDILVPGIKLILNPLTNLINSIKSSVGHINYQLDSIYRVFDGFRHAIPGWLGVLKDIAGSKIVGPIGNVITNLKKRLTDIANSINVNIDLSFITNGIDNIVNTINLNGQIDTIAKGFTSFTDNIIGNVETAFSSVADVLSDIFTQVVSKIKGIVTFILKEIKTKIEYISKTIGGITESIETNVLKIKTSLIGFMQDQIKAFKDTVNPIIENIKEFMVDQIKNFFDLFDPEKIKKIIDIIMEKIKSLWEFMLKIKDVIVKRIKDIINTVFNFIRNLFDMIKNIVYGIFDISIKPLLNSLYNIWVAVVNGAYNSLLGIFDMFKNIYETIKPTINDLISELYNFLKRFGEIFTPVYQYIKDTYEEGSEIVMDTRDIIKYKAIETFLPKETLLWTGMSGIAISYLILGSILLSGVAVYEIIQLKKNNVSSGASITSAPS